MNRRTTITTGLILILVVGGFFGYRQFTSSAQPDASALQTVPVERGDLVASISTAGTIAVPQSATLVWSTTGIAGAVYVSVGDTVRADDVLMRLAPASVPQNVILAQADLIAARQALHDLQNPTELQISETRQAVADVEQALHDLLNPTELQISETRQAVADIEQALHDLLNPTQLQVANGQQAMADAQEALERLQDPTALDVANAQQAVADARDALSDLQDPSAAQIAAAEQRVAAARDALRDQHEALDELLDPDMDTLQDAVRDADFELARAEQDTILTDIGSATSTLDNAQDALETAQERRVSVQKALDACTVHKVEREDERDVHNYMQLTVSEEVVHGGFTYLEGSVYEVFEETGQTMLDTFGSIVTKQSYRVCDPDRGVTVDGVTRTLAEADEDVVAAEDRVLEAELQLESTRMSNTTALDVATEELQDAREALDDALSGADPIDLALAHAAVDDADGELADAQEQLEQLLDPQPEDVAVAAGNLDDAQEQLEQLLDPQPEDVAVATGNLADAEEQLEQLLDPRPADVAVAKATLADVQDELAKLLNPDPDDVTVAEVTLADAKEKLADLLGGPDPDDIAAAEAKVLAVQTTLDSVRVVAPFDSTVVETQSQVGDYVNNNTIALTLADLSYLEVQVNVSELDVNSIFVGQEATLTLDAVSGQTFAGRVADVGFLGSVSQGVVTFPVTVVVDGPDPALKPGMTAAVSIVTERREDVLVVPNRAVRVSGGQRTVAVLWEGQQIVVPVTLGLLSETMSEVIEGELREGDAVAINLPTTTQGGFGGRGGFGGGFGGFGGGRH